MGTLKLLTDQPLYEGHEACQDGLGFDSYAKVIGDAILGTIGPFTVGVFGEWGAGKTSLMRTIVAYLEKKSNIKQSNDLIPAQGVITVWFNAWQFENEDHPIIPLVSTIISKLQEKKKTVQKISDSGKSLIDLLRAVAYGFSLRSKLNVPIFAELEASFVGKEAIEKSEKISQEIFLERSLYYEAFNSLNEFVKRSSTKIVVFIDDLDRCFPDRAIKLLEAIKLVLCQRGFIFVLAVERRVIEGYLQHRYSREYGLKDFKGEKYLDKIVQLSFYIPPHNRRIGTLTTNLLSRLDVNERKVFEPILSIVGAACGSNPRSIIRFINNLLIDQAINVALSHTQQMTEIPIGYFAITRSLQQRWRDIFSILSTTDELCEELGKLDLNNLNSYENKPNDEEHAYLIKVLSSEKDLQNLLYSEYGRAWLQNADMRHATIEFLITERATYTEAEPDETKASEQKALREGIVKWFSEKKGYGFLTDQDGEDIFVHYSSIETPGFKNLVEGQSVEFTVEESDRGKIAHNVNLKN